ncbi:MAG: hypothetical protein PUG16_08210 [Lachnospiraceae bacterium]|jgi:beta-xylosidase|nr:hypothetical protein [Lachnospiraceae bacterium]
MDFNSVSEQLLVTAEVRELYGSLSWKSDCFNILYAMDDGLTAEIDGKRYSGQRILSWFSRNEVHFEAPMDCKAVFLLLRTDLLIDMRDCLPLLEGVCAIDDRKDCDAIGGNILPLCKENGSELLHRPLEKAGFLLNILQGLSDHLPASDPLPKPQIPLSDRRYSLYRAIYTFMLTNYNRGISQAGTAQDFSITPQYLGRLLKEACGKTFRQILSEIRENQKKNYQNYTFLSDEEIEGRLDGQSSIFSFTAGDRLTHQSLPGSAGRLHSSNVVKTSPTDTFMNPKGVYINAQIDPRQHIQTFWKKLINLGYAAELQKVELSRPLSLLRSQIGFSYGRICRILDLVTSYQSGGKEILDFSLVFALLDQLMDNGIIPFLELGNKSLKIQQTSSLSISTEDFESAEAYYKRLEEILPSFIRACINHYGPETFDQWYFEVSYPYTEAEMDTDFTFSQFASRFRKIVKIIRTYSRGARIGGPGFNGWGDQNQSRKKIHRLASSSFQPDFYTIYLYPLVDANGEKRVLSKDVQLLKKRVDLFEKTLEEENRDAEIWITETNSNLSSRTFLNDSCYQASWICRNVLDLIHKGVSSFGYYLFSDTSLRYNDTSDFLFGGWGLLSDANLPKPSYYALMLLNQLGQYYIKSSSQYLITADYPGKFQILLVRYSHPGKEALRSNVTKEDLKDPDRVFDGSGSDRFHVRLKGILPGTYILQESIISSSHSNLLSTWKDLSYIYLLHTPDLESVVSAARLYVRSTSFSVEDDGIFNLDTQLNDNEVRLVSCTLIQERTEADSEQRKGEEREH